IAPGSDLRDQRRMMDHDETEHASAPELAKHPMALADLLGADLAGGDAGWRRHGGVEAHEGDRLPDAADIGEARTGTGRQLGTPVIRLHVAGPAPDAGMPAQPRVDVVIAGDDRDAVGRSE